MKEKIKFCLLVVLLFLTSFTVFACASKLGEDNQTEGCSGVFVSEGGSTSALNLCFTWEWDEAPFFPSGEDHVVLRWNGKNTEGDYRVMDLQNVTVLLAYGKPSSSEVQYVTTAEWTSDPLFNVLDVKIPVEGRDNCRAMRGAVFYTLAPEGQWDIGSAKLEAGYYRGEKGDAYAVLAGEDGSTLYVGRSTGEVPAEFVKTAVAYNTGALIASEERRADKMGIYELMIQPLILYVGAPFAVGALYRLIKGVMKKVLAEERQKEKGEEVKEDLVKADNLIWPSVLFLIIYLEVIITVIL